MHGCSFGRCTVVRAKLSMKTDTVHPLSETLVEVQELLFQNKHCLSKRFMEHTEVTFNE